MNSTTYLRAAHAEAAHLLAERHPLALDGLLTPDQRRLETALGSSKPMPASQVEECRAVLRRVSVGEIDQAAADPIHDHRPQSAPRRKVNRTLAILDQLDRENPNRRFMH